RRGDHRSEKGPNGLGASPGDRDSLVEGRAWALEDPAQSTCSGGREAQRGRKDEAARKTDRAIGRILVQGGGRWSTLRLWSFHLDDDSGCKESGPVGVSGAKSSLLLLRAPQDEGGDFLGSFYLVGILARHPDTTVKIMLFSAKSVDVS